MTRKRLARDKEGKFEWIEYSDFTSSSRKPIKEDLTVDGYIKKYGGIHSHADDKIHTTKGAYMDSLKEKDLVIKDW
jgi:hypothetical protein